MNDLTHYILIRYNVGLYTGNPYNVENPDEYMRKRLPLFKKTLASLEAQTVQGFNVVVGIDENTPESFLEELKSLSYNFTITTKPLDEYIKGQKIDTNWLLTSRLDSDDEYLPEFVEHLYEYIRIKPRKELILDAKGYRSRPTSERVWKERNQPNSQFISLLERSTNPNTIFYGKEHAHAPLDYTARFISIKPLTRTNVHDSNVYYK